MKEHMQQATRDIKIMPGLNETKKKRRSSTTTHDTGAELTGNLSSAAPRHSNANVLLTNRRRRNSGVHQQKPGTNTTDRHNIAAATKSTDAISTTSGNGSVSVSTLLVNRRLSAHAARSMSTLRRNSFEVFDGYSSKEIFEGIRNVHNHTNRNVHNNTSRRASDPSIIGKGVDINMDIESSNSAREYVTWLMDVGDTRSQYGKYSESLLAFREALRVQEMMLGKGHAEIAKTLTRIGGVLGQMNEISEALTNLTEALRIHRLRRGENLALVAHTFQVTGVVYKRSGDLDKAMASYKEALRLRKMILGDDHAEVAITYHNIGNIHYEQGHFMAAMEAYIKCVNSGSSLTKGNVYTASKLHKIGSTLCQLSLFNHGLRAYKEALRVRKLTLEHDNLDIAATLHGIADVYERKGELEDALRAYAEAFSIMLKQLGPDNAAVVDVITRIGSIKSYLKAGSSRKIFEEINRNKSKGELNRKKTKV